jgi:hypothetical protein
MLQTVITGDTSRPLIVVFLLLEIWITISGRALRLAT